MIDAQWLRRPSAYLPVWEAMRDFTNTRTAGTQDAIWLTEHEPVYTLGQAGKPEHILNSAGIPVVHCDRGGQVTYHGPGQVMVYCLVDLRRMKVFVKEYVAMLEDAVIDTLEQLGVAGACRKSGAPGVYVPAASLLAGPLGGTHPDSGAGSAQTAQAGDGGSAGAELAKIAALGIKVRNGCAYHGLALNVDMDLTPFLGINPCGYQGLKTVDLRACGIKATVQDVGERMAARLEDVFAHTTA
jgi:lipoyl(octanoyl) transferase